MVAGFELLGDLPETGLFPKQFRPPRISKQELMKTAKVAQSEAVRECTSSGDAELDKAVYEKTLAEENEGWISAPMSSREICEKVGPLHIVNKRFGIHQGGKIRQIDDFSRHLTFPMPRLDSLRN
jgi:hypothetical protein